MTYIKELYEEHYKSLKWHEKVRIYVVANLIDPITSWWYDLKNYIYNVKAFHKELKEFRCCDYDYTLCMWRKSLQLLRDGVAADTWTEKDKAVEKMDEAISILTDFIEEKYEPYESYLSESITNEDFNELMLKSNQKKAAAWDRFCEILKGQNFSNAEAEKVVYDGTGIESWWT